MRFAVPLLTAPLLTAPLPTAPQLTAALLTLALLAGASPATAAPDLVVDSLDSAPTSGPNGTTVAISATIRNQGDSFAAASVARVRINVDPNAVVPTDAQLCGSVATPSLEPGASAEVGCSQQLSERPGGLNYVWINADVNKNIGQEITTNDKRSTSFNVVGQSSDLVLKSISVDPDAIRNGEEVTVRVSIKNEGAAAALASTTRVRINQDSTSLTPSDPVVCNISTPNVSPGATVNLRCDETISSRPAGTNYVWAIADVNKTAGQSSTANDRANAALEIAAEASDLVVDSVVVDPTSGRNGDSVTVTATIRNQGTLSASSSITRVRINQNPNTVTGTDLQVCEPINTSSMAVGAVQTVECDATFEGLPPGLHSLWVIADTSDAAGQADRTNDRAKAEFIVDPDPLPDLTVQTLTLNSTSALNGKSVSVTARIANVGEGPSPATKTRIVINLDPTGVAAEDVVLCDQVSTQALNPGASVQVSCKPTIVDRPFGANTVWAIADVNTVSGQVNLANDGLTATLTVLPPPAPDLVVESLTATPSSAEGGTQIALAAKVRNQGNLPAAASTARIRINASAIAVLDSDPIVCGSLATPALAVGAAADLACNWVVSGRAPGQAFLWAISDASNTAGQVVRSNDTRASAFTVLAPDGPNLTVKRLVVRPTSARNGETILVKARIVNVGNESADASVTTFRLNQDPGSVDDSDEVLCETVPTPALAPTQGARVRCHATIHDRPIGAHSVWSIVDTAGTSGDVNPSDDRRGAALSVVDLTCDASTGELEMDWPIEQPRVIQDYASFGSIPLAGGRLGYHSGMDLLTHLPLPADLTPVYAAAAGEIVAVRRNCPSPADPVANPPSGRCAGGWGNYVVLRHRDGLYSLYAHLGQVFAVSGCVEQGERIAIAGSSGSTTIPAHLHFGVLADLPEPVARSSFGYEYYRKLHPLVGRVPETDSGSSQVHLDPRDFMRRSRIVVTQATTASLGLFSGGTLAYLAAGQEFVSYGELVPGYFCIDLPLAAAPQDGPPYADDARYGWVAASKIDVLDSGFAPGSVRIDGYGVFADQGVGAGGVALRSAASTLSAEISKAWGDQQFAPAGVPVAEAGSGALWQPVDVPGTSASGMSGPREAFVPVDALGAAPAH